MVLMIKTTYEMQNIGNIGKKKTDSESYLKTVFRFGNKS